MVEGRADTPPGCLQWLVRQHSVEGDSDGRLEWLTVGLVAAGVGKLKRQREANRWGERRSVGQLNEGDRDGVAVGRKLGSSMRGCEKLGT